MVAREVSHLSAREVGDISAAVSPDHACVQLVMRFHLWVLFSLHAAILTGAGVLSDSVDGSMVGGGDLCYDHLHGNVHLFAFDSPAATSRGQRTRIYNWLKSRVQRSTAQWKVRPTGKNNTTSVIHRETYIGKRGV